MLDPNALENILRDAAVELTATLDQLANAKNELGGVLDGKNILDREVEEVQTKLDTANTLLDGLAGKLSDGDALIVQKTEEAKAIQGTIDGLESTRKTLETKISGFQGELDVLNDKARKENAATLAKYDGLISDKKAELTVAQNMLADTTAQIESLKSGIEIANDELVSTQKEHDSINKEIGILKARLTELHKQEEDYSDKISGINSVLVEKQVELDDLSAKISTATDAIATLNVQKDELDTEIASLPPKIAEAKAQIADINRRSFDITKREKDNAQKEQYIIQMYQEAGVPFTPYSPE